MAEHKTGDTVKVYTKEKVHEGVLMPGEYTDMIVIKLDSGYNIGIEKSKVSKIELVKQLEEKEGKHAKIGLKKGLPTISILHTGGTIASKVDYRTGGVVSAFTPEDLISMFPEIQEIANVNSELVASMWSDDLRFAHFKLLAHAIEKKVKEGCDGIIIGMGTDNLAVASAAMSFIVESTPIPIIFVGAQRSSDRGSSDAEMNLICAAEFIAKANFAGVAICMHEHTDDKTCVILPPNKTKKMHSSRRDAFKAINDVAIARVEYKTRKIEFLKKDIPEHAKKDAKRKLVIKPNMEDKVGLLKIHVNMFPEEFEFFKEKGYKGLVIEGTGLGHTPLHVPNELAKIHKEIAAAIKKVNDSGCIMVMTVQTIYGRVNMNVYNKGRDLQDLGVISGEDMLAETAYVKLAWLLGNYDAEEARKLMGVNLRGELNERITPDEFLK